MKPLVLVLLLCLFRFTAYSQCADTFEIKEIRKASEGQKDGRIVLAIKSASSYNCELISFKNANRVKVAEKSGTGSGTITFDQLENKNFYRITVNFPAEEDPLCQSRIVDQIMLESPKQKL